jgi:UDP-N-acetylglucosamine 1-carboxyvinyltransferase
MQKFIVEGGRNLKGTISVSGSKNASIKMIAASLLSSEDVTLSNVPNISDVEVILGMVRNLGTEVSWLDENKVRLKSLLPVSKNIPAEVTRTTRSAIMLMAPLLARYGGFSICSPGGDSIGVRPINRHLEALSAFGAEIGQKENCCFGTTRAGLRGAEIGFKKNTVMGTETAILAGVLASGKTTINNAAAEPEIDDLILLLNKMGAKIFRRDERIIDIEGVTILHGASHEVMPDRNEAVTLAVAGAATRGDVTITKIVPQHLTSFLAKISKMGVNYEVGKSSLRIWVDRDTVFNPIDVETSPYPGFMTDWQQPFSVLLTQAQGISHIHETIYLNRFEYSKELNRMGAKIELVTPSSRGIKSKTDEEYDIEASGEPLTLAEITGPVSLVGRRLNIPDLRAGATLVIAALCAKGQSEIFGIEHIDRGYENFEAKLNSLGAQIERAI